MSKSSSWSRKVATPAVAPAVIKLTPLDSFLNDLNKNISTENTADIDFIALSKTIINFDVDLVNRGSLAQKTWMQRAVILVASHLDKSSSENTSLAIDNLCQISALYNITLNSKQILDFATKRLGEASQPEISYILHSLVHCGLSQEHCTKYSKEILAAFITSSNNILGAPWINAQKLSDTICSLSHLKNLGILSNDPKLVIILKNIHSIIEKRKITPKRTTLNSLLEVRLYCKKVLEIGLDNMKNVHAEFANTISPIQEEIFELIIELLAKQHLIKKIDNTKRTIHQIGNNCTIELEGLYGRSDGQLIRSADIIIKIDNDKNILVIEVDGSTHFTNIDKKQCITGQTMVRNQIIQAVTANAPIIINTTRRLTASQYIKEVSKDAAFSALRNEISSTAVASPVQEEVASPVQEEVASPATLALDLDVAEKEDAASAVMKVKVKMKTKAETTVVKKPTKHTHKTASAVKKLSEEEELFLTAIRKALLEKPIKFTVLKEGLDALLENNFDHNLLYDHSIVINEGQKDYSYNTTIFQYIVDSFDPRLMLIFLEYDQKFVAKNSYSSATPTSLVQRLNDLITSSKKSDLQKYSILSKILQLTHLERPSSERPSSKEEPLTQGTKNLTRSKKGSKKEAPKSEDEQEKEELLKYITNFDSANYSQLLTAAICANEPWKVRFLLLNNSLVDTLLAKKDPSVDEESYYPVHIAVMENKVDMLRLLLGFGANLLQQGSHGSNLLHLAAANGSLAMMEDIPEEWIRELSLQKTKINNKTVANVAVNYGHLNILEFLHNNQVIFDVNDVKFALLKNNLQILEFLYSVNPTLFIEAKKEIALACHKAVSNSNLNLLKFLCETLKASTAIPHKGNTLLHSATNGDADTLQYVLDTIKLPIETKNTKGETALYYAVINDKIAAATFLIDKGADIIAPIPFIEGEEESESEASESEESESEASESEESGEEEEEVDLSDKDSGENFESDDPPPPPRTLSLHADEGFEQYNVTSLHYAAGNGNLAMLKMLLSHQAAMSHINRRNYLGNTILHEAARNNYYEVVKYLVLEIKMPIDAINSKGFTPLMSAIEVAQNETSAAGVSDCDAWPIINFLCEKAPKNIIDFNKSTYINAKSHRNGVEANHQQTALGLAIRYHLSHGEPKNSLIKLLLTNEALLNVKNDNGRTILANAILLNDISEEGLMAIAKLLLACSKKDFDQPDNEGDTLLHFATQKDYQSLISHLVGLHCNTNAENQRGIIPIVFARSQKAYDLLNAYNPQYPSKQDKLLISMKAAIEVDNVAVFQSLLEKMREITSSTDAANGALEMIAQCIAKRENDLGAKKKDTIWQCMLDAKMVQSKTATQYLKEISSKGSPSSAYSSADGFSSGAESPSGDSSGVGITKLSTKKDSQVEK